jgi:CDP-glycerol glycerophosphotransferase (TagB/SpsB family)
LQFTEARGSHDVLAAFALSRRTARARKAASEIEAFEDPPSTPYVFFGLHFQPESSIDVWAPFFSNQLWVIELISRSIPPTHKLLVKVHKSDISKHSRETFDKMSSFPSVEFVRPFADARRFIEKADLVVAIQGTIGLEAALLGKPVIMLGDSPVTIFPNASQLGAVADFPRLIRRKLAESPPSREQIVMAYSSYLAPFLPASHNDWRKKISAEEIDNYVGLFEALKQHLMDHSAIRRQTAL